MAALGGHQRLRAYIRGHDNRTANGRRGEDVGVGGGGGTRVDWLGSPSEASPNALIPSLLPSLTKRRHNSKGIPLPLTLTQLLFITFILSSSSSSSSSFFSPFFSPFFVSITPAHAANPYPPDYLDPYPNSTTSCPPTVEPLAGCPHVVVNLPFAVNFSAAYMTDVTGNGGRAFRESPYRSSASSVYDSNGHATGFTIVEYQRPGVWYRPDLLTMDFNRSRLSITAIQGTSVASTNQQVNRLAVGIPGPYSAIVSVTIFPFSGSGHLEQAGLWFGRDKNNYASLAIVNNPAPAGWTVELYVEIGASPFGSTISLPIHAWNVRGTRFSSLPPIALTITANASAASASDYRQTITASFALLSESSMTTPGAAPSPSPTPSSLSPALSPTPSSFHSLPPSISPSRSPPHPPPPPSSFSSSLAPTFAPNAPAPSPISEQPSGWVQLGSVLVPSGTLFTADQANMDPRTGTSTFAGISASSGSNPKPVVASFTNFSINPLDASCAVPPIAGARVKFRRFDTQLTYSPTSLVWFEPEKRLYGVDYTGLIHRYTIDLNTGKLLKDESFNALSGRLTLGVTIEPGSKAGNVSLWITSSLGKGLPTSRGVANSARVDRVTGPKFDNVKTVFFGLPRSRGDHAINGVNFMPDNQTICWSQAGNTGSGGSSTYSGLFNRPEQVLSGGLFCHRILGPNGGIRTDFVSSKHGNCTTWLDDGTGISDTNWPKTCTVKRRAAGLRNMYDFVFHSNGYAYGATNGVGLPSTVPASPQAPCQGKRTYQFPLDPLDPTVQPDLLHRLDLSLVENHGHPNPAMGECIFMDGAFQKVGHGNPGYVDPMFVLGPHVSPDGMVEYTSNRFCGEMKGDLIIAEYAAPDDLIRVKLSADGKSVTEIKSISKCLNDPLALATDPRGNLYVGGFNSVLYSNGTLTVLLPDYDESKCPRMVKRVQ